MVKFNCISTGIGSLPLKNAKDALSIIFNNSGIPFWPQLPKRDFREQMIPQYSEGMPGVRFDPNKERIWVELHGEREDAVYKFYNSFLEGRLESFAISEVFSTGFHEFLRELKEKGSGRYPARFEYLKGQVTGPITFSLGLADKDRRPIYYDEELRDIAVKLISMKALYQIRELEGFGAGLIIFIDEPIFSALGSSAYLGIAREDVIKAVNEVIDAIHSKGALAGIHCCGNTDWSLVASTGIDILNFDAYHFFDSITLYPEDIKAFLNREGTIAWGIIPTGVDILNETAESLSKRLKNNFDVLRGWGVRDETLLGQCLITPSCGTGSLEIDQAKRVFELLKGVTKGLG